MSKRQVIIFSILSGLGWANYVVKAYYLQKSYEREERYVKIIYEYKQFVEKFCLQDAKLKEVDWDY